MENVLKNILFALLVIPVLMSSVKTEKDQSKKGFKVGVALYSFSQHSFEKAINMVDSCEVKYIEGLSFFNLGGSYGNTTMINLSDEALLRMKKELKKHGVTMPSMYIAGAADASEWKKYFEMGKYFSVKIFVCEPPREQLDMVDSLASIYKIKIAIHNHDKPNGYWNPDSLLTIIKKHKHIGVCADIGHWAISGLDPVNCLKILDGHILSLHLKDVGKNNADVVPGTGIINFDALAAELKRQHFNGYVQVECEHNMENNQADVKKAVDYFNLHSK